MDNPRDTYTNSQIKTMLEHRTPISAVLKGHIAGSAIHLENRDNAEEKQHHPERFVAFEEIACVD